VWPQPPKLRYMNQMPYPLSESEIENEKQPFGGGPRPWQIESVIESRKLKVQLEAAALDHQPQDKALRSRAMDLLHGALFRGRMIAKERLEAGADGRTQRACSQRFRTRLSRHFSISRPISFMAIATAQKARNSPYLRWAAMAGTFWRHLLISTCYSCAITSKPHGLRA